MRPSRPLRTVLLSLACSLALAAQAQTAARLEIPAGDLATALDAYARQSGAQLVYRADQLKGAHSPGVHDQPASPQALDALLAGSGFRAQRDASGAVLIVPIPTTKPAPPRQPQPVNPPKPSATGEHVTELGAVQVTGSRIPRTKTEGAAPITVVSAADIRAAGFTSVPELLHSLSQNGGETQGQQSSMGAATTPGAQQVDLRGLGPNHTLVLINGRRIADFPLPFQGRSNFTDIGSIPLGMVDRVEILTGSASAIYGSDAMSGVINFILKKSADGTTLDYRYGFNDHGGGASEQLTVTSGFDTGSFSGVVGLQLLNQRPLWATQRRAQASTLNAPDAADQLPRSVATLYDDDDDINIGPADNCAAMRGINEGTTGLAQDPDYGPYCGSTRAIAYGTIVTERRGATAYASLQNQFSDNLSWFADLQLGFQKVSLMNDTTSWAFQDAASYRNYANVFYNAHTGRVESWDRQFSPEEMGGLANGMNHTTEKTFGIATGLRGAFGDNWDWEAAWNHSQYYADVSFARIRADTANRLFLGPSLGYDADGYAIYDADPARLFTPLTPAQYASIAATSTFHPKARTDTATFTVNSPALFTLPAGKVGFAGVLEYGSQSYRINPDPLALTTYYFGARYGDGHGSRDHWSLAGELRAPITSTLTASVAGRYDLYQYANKSPDKPTYSLGLEWRPDSALLVRGSYGTGFRAPDLHYLFAGQDFFRTRATDYYRCREDYPGDPISDCRSSLRRARVTNIRTGNPDLGVETSRSFTAGFVWSPNANLDLSADYFDIRVLNQVQDMSIDRVLRAEADCRLGTTMDGAPVDVNSPTCQDALARVIRDAANGGVLKGVHFNPINIASERTSGVDLAAHYRWQTQTAGDFRFTANYTWVRKHTSQQYPGDPIVNQLAVDSGYDIPRNKANLGVSWERGRWGASLFGNYLGRIPNYDSDAWIPGTWRFNAGARYDITDHLRVALSIDNLFDKMPPRDPTYTSYPYYDISWFDTVGRSYNLQLTWKLGGKAL
ncbi:MAG: TonB-dependent receptor [Proteobacteria bacterium]|nr:TonB-dependent receptor [Pseudomonadota bacterium]